MRPRTYRAFVFLEVVLIVIFLFALVPIQDYAIREFREYMRNPSPQTRQAFLDKKREETRLHEKIAIPIACIAVVLMIPIFRNRPGRPNRLPGG